MILSTICYIESENDFLMLLRNKKPNDMNGGKWIGVGGKIESGESPEECVLREIVEETGLTVHNLRLRGILTFCYENQASEYIFVYTANTRTRNFSTCSEGDLYWIPKSQVNDLPLWEGDRIFLSHLMEDTLDILGIFSLKLTYDRNGKLISAAEEFV